MKSDAVTKGIQQAPHRSLFNALGMTKEEKMCIRDSFSVLSLHYFTIYVKD